ncbi:MAG: hypothetical protein MZV70_76115 [Desulfobacterales bacterium]|nr:hypothetical protein [Desulfobacterales bacterium]
MDDEPADHIKIVNSGLNSLTEYGSRTAPQFGLDGNVAPPCRRPQRADCPSWCTPTARRPCASPSWRDADPSSTGSSWGRDNLARMADRGVAWVPTAVTDAGVRRVADRQAGRNPDVARRTLDHQLEQLALARRLGVTVALGTDSGSPGVHHGAAVIAEMGLLMQAGFTLAEAVRCASAQRCEAGRRRLRGAGDGEPGDLRRGKRRTVESCRQGLAAYPGRVHQWRERA